MELSSPTIAGHSFGSTTVLRTLNADKRFKWVGFPVTRINCFHEKLFAGSDWPWMPGCGRLETSRNWPRAWNNHFCSSIRKLFRRPPIWKRWSDSRSIRRITLSGASLLWSSYKSLSLQSITQSDRLSFLFWNIFPSCVYPLRHSLPFLFVFQFPYIRGSVHYSQNDVPSLLPWYIRRFAYNSIIDPLLALQLNHRMTLLYLRKHLGIDTFLLSKFSWKQIA